MSHFSVNDLVQPEPGLDLNTRSSFSALTLHRKCPQAWYYRYVLRVEEERDDMSPYAQLGIWWGALRAVESFERGWEAGSLVRGLVPDKLEDKREGFSFWMGGLMDESQKFGRGMIDLEDVAAEMPTVERVLRAAAVRWDKMGAQARDDFEDALGGDLVSRLDSMFTVWSLANTERFEDEEPLGVEVRWERVLPRPTDDLAWSIVKKSIKVPPMVLLGYIDEVYRDKRHGDMIVIRDHKAPKDIARNNTALDDFMDSQLELYAWGSAELFKANGIRPARAVGYDRTRSVAASKPSLTAAGKLSKSVTNYPLTEYLDFCETDTTPDAAERAAIVADKGLTGEQANEVLNLPPGPFWGKIGEFYTTGARKGEAKFGVYEQESKEVERLSTPVEQQRWTSRTLTPVNSHTVRAHLRSATDTALDIWQTQLRGKEVGEAARSLTRHGCNMCLFQGLCRAQMIGGPSGEYDLASFGLRQKPPRKTADKETKKGKGKQ